MRFHRETRNGPCGFCKTIQFRFVLALYAGEFGILLKTFFLSIFLLYSIWFSNILSPFLSFSMSYV